MGSTGSEIFTDRYCSTRWEHLQVIVTLIGGCIHREGGNLCSVRQERFEGIMVSTGHPLDTRYSDSQIPTASSAQAYAKTP